MKLFVSTPDLQNTLSVAVFTPKCSIPYKLKCKIDVPQSEMSSTEYIQNMLHVKIKGRPCILLARKGGIIELRGSESPNELLYSWNESTVDDSDFVVGMAYVNEVLYSCSNRGLLLLRDLSNINRGKHCPETANSDRKSDLLEHYQGNAVSWTINEPISFFKVHPIHSEICLVGGYNNEVEILDITSNLNLLTGSVLIEGLDRNSKFKLKIAKYAASIQPIWKAKVHTHPKRGDSVYIKEEFSWPQDAVFLDPERKKCSGFKICCGSRFGKLMVYDTSLSRYAISQLTVSNHSITNVKLLVNDSLVMFVDSCQTVGIVNLVIEEIVNYYRIPMGSISSCECLVLEDPKAALVNKSLTFTNPILFIVGGIDKKLRVYRLDNNNQCTLIGCAKTSSIMPSICLALDNPVDKEAVHKLLLKDFHIDRSHDDTYDDYYFKSKFHNHRKNVTAAYKLRKV
ncbi:Hypothetical protein KP2612_004408 [Komagataella phaffii]|nr:GQ67_04405T0 [Komagataella phaffii]AOA69916.1 GQ68_04377T0 [Komagataella phaffii GS115]